MRDLISNIAVEQVLKPQVITGNATSTAIDMKGANSLVVSFLLGASADTLSGAVKWTLSLTHSDNDADYAAVDGDDLTYEANDYPQVVDSNSEDETVYSLGYNGGKRYVKAVITAAGSHSGGTPVAVAAIKGTLNLAFIVSAE